MATIVSLDPRVSRWKLADEPARTDEKPSLDQFQTFEVFHQQKSGAHHVHVGSIHAPNAEMALVLAKEQYGRRGPSMNMWVVDTRHVTTLRAEDSDIFETTPEKTYRDVGAYMVRNKVEAYKKEQANNAPETPEQSQ
jgi:ring-1,2-phenylacetyl-CoA epoxidase subunit PaaB